MTYTKTDEAHVCQLPDPSEFKHGDVIACTETILTYGHRRECGRRWEYYTTFWQNTPRWRAWGDGW